MGVEPGPGRGAAERDLADPAQRRLDPLDAEPHLRRVAAELLAERDRDRVHQVGAAGLDDVGEALRLLLQRRLQPAHRRQQVVGHLAQRRQVDGGGEDVVGGLAHVDVIVGVGAVAGEVGDHLVGVHVRGGAGAGLEDIDRELVVVLALGDCGARRGDPLGQLGVEEAQLGVGLRRCGLDAAEPADHRHRHPLARDREVVDGLGRLAAPELLAQIHRLHRSRHGFSVFGGGRGRRLSPAEHVAASHPSQVARIGFGPMPTVRDASFDLFRAQGMTTMFGNPGSTELPMLAEFPGRPPLRARVAGGGRGRDGGRLRPGLGADHPGQPPHRAGGRQRDGGDLQRAGEPLAAADHRRPAGAGADHPAGEPDQPRRDADAAPAGQVGL